MLICPKCKCPLEKDNNTYKCVNNHSYDIAKEGYINLLLNKVDAGDNKEMVNGRVNFLNKGYYDPLALELCKSFSYIIRKESIILDGGCGSGYYDSYLIKEYPNLIGYDISKYAIAKAAKLNNNNLFFVSSGACVSLSDKSVDLILNIFAPTFEDEAARLLNDDGYLVLVTPSKNHLIELKQHIYESAYLNSEKSPEFKSFFLYNKKELEYSKTINNEDILNLVKMTPYFYKTSSSDLAKLNSLDKLDITFSFNILIYKKTKM